MVSTRSLNETRSAPAATHAEIAIDVRSLAVTSVGGVLDQIVRAGATVQIGLVKSRVDVPCISCRIWSPDFPVVSSGHGAHSAPEIALSRAITEAAQSRLTAISGSRDDTANIYGEMRHGLVTGPWLPMTRSHGTS